MPESSRTHWTAALLYAEGDFILSAMAQAADLQSARETLYAITTDCQMSSGLWSDPNFHGGAVARDCARALRGMLSERSERLAGCSVVQALWDVARGAARPDLGEGFFAELVHICRGLRGTAKIEPVFDSEDFAELSGREAALARSSELDRLWQKIETKMRCSPDGLNPECVARREKRREAVLRALGGTSADWENWEWHVAHVVRDEQTLSRTVRLSASEAAAVARNLAAGLPFGLTPYYAALLDDDPEAGRDRAVRAQVLPPEDYVREMERHAGERGANCDFMREQDTSPVDLVTRRYPAVCILKPFNTCPQICVYCQRNWEIEQAMAPAALAPWEKIETACAWLEAHPAIREVLVTGGDPLALPDRELLRILDRVAAIPHVDLIRIGTRTPVTLPMRVTPALAESLGRLRLPGRREVCVVTHVEHPYEITPELVAAVNRLRLQGIAVYNQLVYTFFVSRRFEAAHLRLALRRAGIDPYYTFAPKGKEETRPYRLPLARMLQEQKEEARLLPGTRRTDELVYNLPALGKNYLRAVQHRDLICIRPDGARVYEFHPWEKNILERASYVGEDVPVLEYLRRLEACGENPADYASIWYYF